MATGYTASVTETTTLEEFVMNCATAFFYDCQKVPEDRKVDKYHIDTVSRAKRNLTVAMGYTVAEAEVECEREYQSALKSRNEYKAKQAKNKAKYNRLVKLVKGWKIPTPEHQALKDFMLTQLKDIIEFDCGIIWEAPKKVSAEVWLFQNLSDARSSLARAQKKLLEEEQQVQKTNEWVAALKQSLE